jgi:putative phosphoribosyl transferase
MQKPFKNRMQAGMLLARQLMPYARRPDVIVLALPRGGVPLGFMVAQALNVPLDVLLVRKLGLPGHSEYAIGAISTDQSLLQTDIIKALGVPMEAIEAVAARERKEMERREALYRGDRPPLQLRDKVVILVDDGLATGSTMRVAIQTVRKAQPAKVIVAVPVSAPEACRELAAEADEMVCLSTPQPFYAVGQWYEDFGQTSDEEVTSLLEEAERTRPPVTIDISSHPTRG